eukprot:symbB.v1.2.019075.t2/scaffold1542.1/size112718/10
MSQMIMDHAAGADIALVGEKGSGKSTLVNAFATILGYRTRNLFCYRDMSSRDLLQRRTTDPWGNTGWSDSPLVQASIDLMWPKFVGSHLPTQQAALHGDLAVLHGVHRLSKMVCTARWNDALLAKPMGLIDGERPALALGARKVHPSFRLVVCGDLPESFSGPFAGNWIDEEVSTLFHFHRVLDLPLLEQRKLVTGLAGEAMRPSTNAEDQTDADSDWQGKKQSIDTLLSLSQKIKGACKDPDLKPLQLSLRALLRTARHLAFRPNDLAGALERCFSARFKFLEASQRSMGQRLLAEVGIEVKSDKAPVDVRIELHLGQVRCPQRHPAHPELVPKVQFVEISNHMAILQNMLASWNAGEHLLLVGNQGVGKNKLADHLLCLLRCERQYIQLHRDTTVQSLTATPTLEAGVVCWQDSALLRAATLGHCVVVDEADKAPLEVVCILKALAEDSELTLPDGRTLVRHNDERLSLPRDSADELVPVAAGFRMIVLANRPDTSFCLISKSGRVHVVDRPGHPFLGNDFYRVCGDVFDCHVVEYLDIASELELLRSIAPTVPEGQLATFSQLFRELRQLADAGHTTYPYSTRELVKIVSHAQQFPGDSIEYLAADVFSFDAFEDRQKLVEAFRHLGIAKGKDGEAMVFGESRGNQHLELGSKKGDDDGELSDSTRAALRIQQEIDGKGPSKDEATGRTRSSKASKSTTDGTHGAVTGIALGEYANKKGGSGTVHIKMKGGKAGIFSESLESLAYRQDSDDEVNPEAPSGSFRQKDLEREARNAGKEATVGLDGKVYSFIDAPSDESSAEEAAKKSAQKGADKRKSKKDKKSKKDSKKKEKKKKAKKRKRSSTSSAT